MQSDNTHQISSDFKKRKILKFVIFGLIAISLTSLTAILVSAGSFGFKIDSKELSLEKDSTLCDNLVVVGPCEGTQDPPVDTTTQNNNDDQPTLNSITGYAQNLKLIKESSARVDSIQYISPGDGSGYVCFYF